MKFRSSLQVFRSDSKQDAKSRNTAAYSRILGAGSTSNVDNVANEKPTALPPIRQDPKSTPTRKAMQDFLQKTGAGLRATGASLKAKSAKRVPRRKSKVARRWSPR